MTKTPFPCYINDKFLTAIANLLPLFMVLAWIYTVAMMTKGTFEFMAAFGNLIPLSFEP
jgi:hypothetical protein